MKTIKDKFGHEYEINEHGKVERVYLPKRGEYIAPYKYDRKQNCNVRIYVTYSHLKNLEREEYSNLTYHNI